MAKRRGASWIVTAALAAVVAASAVPAASAEGGPEDLVILTAVIVSPPNATKTTQASIAASVYADGGLAMFANDPFVNGTFVGSLLTAGGVGPNSSAASNTSFYVSQPFALPEPGKYRWIATIDISIAGTSNDPGPLLNYSARFADAGALNWTAWYDVDIAGAFNETTGPNASVLARPVFQYRVEFTQPQNASTPTVVLAHAWYISLFDRLEARVGESAPWVLVSREGGLFNLTANLTEGANTMEARAFDSAGHERVSRVIIFRDTTGPDIESAPAEGAVIAQDGAAAIEFNEPIDRASASVNIVVDAPFTVDQVWSGDNRTLFLSAAGVTTRGVVTVTIRGGLRDSLGNTLGREQVYHYTMGATPPDPGFANFIFPLVGLATTIGVIALWHSERVRKQNREHADRVARESEERAAQQEPPK